MSSQPQPPNVERQRPENKKGEIRFKEKLYALQVEGKPAIQDEFDARGIEEILGKRMAETLADMRRLQAGGVTLSPYLEVGAERCQRALVLENDLDARGVAADLSHAMLKSCEHYRAVFGKGRSPVRVCCDVNNLPFPSNSFPFVYCYQTLHHFPDPAPIVRELHRVVAPGGYFFFAEEPYRRVLHLDLYASSSVYSKESLDRSLFRKVLDYFFSEETCNETGYGVIENHDVTTAQWRSALAVFAERDVEIRRTEFFRASLYPPRSPLRYLGAWLLGGLISGKCRKDGPAPAGAPAPIRYLCPSCREEKGTEVELADRGGALTCPACSRRYPLVDGVRFLFSHATMKELYPDAYAAARAAA